jgi:hypothetical protein
MHKACLNEQDGLAREKYLNSGMGKRYLKNRLRRFLSLTGEPKKRPIGFLVEEPKVPYVRKMKKKIWALVRLYYGTLTVCPMRFALCDILR